MVQKLPETKKVFEGEEAEQLKGRGTKDFLIGKTLLVKAYSIYHDQEKNTDSAIMLFTHNNKKYSGVFGGAILQKLQEAEGAYGVNQKEGSKEKHFKEEIEVTLQKETSAKGREYFTIE
jgi:hypothetical protein